jgi:hypothetical protein
VQVCEPLYGIGEGLLVDLGVLGADAVAASSLRAALLDVEASAGGRDRGSAH